MNLDKRFPKKRIIITGAGSGLGRALAIEFAKMHWRIAIAEINKQRAHETAKLVNRDGGEPLVIQCDVTKPGDFIKASNALDKEWGGVDILVNNAGVAAAGYFEDIPLDTWEWIIALNQKSVIYGCRTFIPLFKEQGQGHIVNVASNAGIASLAEMSCYNVTKAAVISASETLRIELAPFNIGVTVVCPTFFKTNLMDQFQSPDKRQRLLAEKFFEKSRTTAKNVAQLVIKSVRKNRLYVVTPADGKFVWLSKRYTPELYFKIASFIYKKGYMDKYLGIDY